MDVWESISPYDQPTTEIFTEEAYSKRKYFHYNEICEACDFIYAQIEEYLKS